MNAEQGEPSVPGLVPPSSFSLPSSLWLCASVVQLFAVNKLVGCPFERAAWLRPPEDDLLDLFGQREILVGDAASRMRLELDPNLAPGNGEVGMVIGRLTQ